MTNTMWGGRFAASPAEIMEEINASIDFDKRLWRHDILASKAHVTMLAATGIVTKKDAREISKGLDQILAEMEAGKFKFSRALEDIHLNVESRLHKLIGPVAGKLHTARSRNDQVALPVTYQQFIYSGTAIIVGNIHPLVIQPDLLIRLQIIPDQHFLLSAEKGGTHLDRRKPVHTDMGNNIVREIEAQGLKRAVLVGAGFIGIEMAEALVNKGLDVTITEMEGQIMPAVLDKDIATFTAKYLRQNGVKLVLGERVTAISGEDRAVSVETDKQSIPADLVIVAVGTRPNDKLAKEIGERARNKEDITFFDFHNIIKLFYNDFSFFC